MRKAILRRSARLALVGLSGAFLFFGGLIDMIAQSIDPEVQRIPLPGSPFAVAVTPDGQYAFASLSGATEGIAVIKHEGTSASLVRVLTTEGPVFGLAVTSDGRYLLDTIQGPFRGVQVIDIQRAIAADADAILGTVPTLPGSGPIEVALTNDNRFIFVANEDNETVTVIDFRKALESGESASSIVGNIRVDRAPVGLAVSPDDSLLYVSNESANPTDPGYDPTACPLAAGGTTGKGTLIVIDVRKAETDPATSVLGKIYAGCSPVRVVLSDRGEVAWVTARGEDHVLAFDTRRILNDPAQALLSTTPVGSEPVGLQLFDHERLIAVANSNRFVAGQIGTVSILDYRKAIDGAGSAATVETFAAGQFPRQWALSRNDRFLYLTEFSSNTLAIFPVHHLVRDVRGDDK